MTTVFLIRHGESQSNAGLSTIGPENVALTLQGYEQARQIASFLISYSSLDLIVTSPYWRTKQTAEPTLSIFSSVPTEEWDVQEFTYLSSMHQEQSTTEERRPLVEAYWEQCQPLFVDGPGSESFAQFIGRVQSFMMRLQDTIYDSIAVFGHAQFINAVLWLIESRSVEISAQAMQSYRDFLNQYPLANGTIVQLKVRHNDSPWSFEQITEQQLQPEPNAELECERERNLEPVG